MAFNGTSAATAPPPGATPCWSTTPCSACCGTTWPRWCPASCTAPTIPTPARLAAAKRQLRAAHADQPARPSPMRVGRAVPPGLRGPRPASCRHGVREPRRAAPGPHPALRRHLPHDRRPGADALQVGRRPGRPGVRLGPAVRGRHQPGRARPALLAVRPLEPLPYRHPGRLLHPLRGDRGGARAHSCNGSSTNTTKPHCGGISWPAGCRASWSTACWCASSRWRPARSAARRRRPRSARRNPEGAPDLDGRPGEPARGPPCRAGCRPAAAAAPARPTWPRCRRRRAASGSGVPPTAHWFHRSCVGRRWRRTPRSRAEGPVAGRLGVRGRRGGRDFAAPPGSRGLARARRCRGRASPGRPPAPGRP